MSRHIEWAGSFEAELHDPGDPEHPDLLYADGWEPTGDSYALALWLTGQDAAAVIEYETGAARTAAIAELARRAGVKAADLVEPPPGRTNYRVSWEFDAEDVSSPEDAARAALEAIVRPGSIAHVFHVTPADGAGPTVEVDLDQPAARPLPADPRRDLSAPEGTMKSTTREDPS